MIVRQLVSIAFALYAFFLATLVYAADPKPNIVFTWPTISATPTSATAAAR